MRIFGASEREKMMGAVSQARCIQEAARLSLRAEAGQVISGQAISENNANVRAVAEEFAVDGPKMEDIIRQNKVALSIAEPNE